MVNKFIYICGLVMALAACNSESNYNKTTWVEVNGSTLKKSDVLAQLQENTSSEDSARIVDEYTDKWIKKQLLLYKAEQNIGNTQEIQKLIDEYREKLLIENYLKLLVERKAQIKPSQDQINDLYDKTKDQLVLKEDLLKGIFVVIPLNAPNQDILKQLLNTKELDRATIEAYCLQNAAKIDFFIEKWVPYRMVKQHIPEQSKSNQQILSKNTFFETKDTVFNYIIKIEDYKLEGETTPLSYIQEELETYLLNINKVDYLKKMEKDIYDEAKRKGLINFYQ